jgi:hypothetical protein
LQEPRISPVYSGFNRPIKSNARVHFEEQHDATDKPNTGCNKQFVFNSLVSSGPGNNTKTSMLYRK